MSRLQRYLDLPKDTNPCRSLKRPTKNACSGCPLDPHNMCIFITEMNVWTPMAIENLIEKTFNMRAYPCPD